MLLSSNKNGRWNVSKVYCQSMLESTVVETHLPMKLNSEKRTSEEYLS